MRFALDALFEKVEQDRHISSYDIAEELDADQKEVSVIYESLGIRKNLTFGYHMISLRET